MSNETTGGVTTLSEDVVATIAAMAAKAVDGVYNMGRTNFKDLFKGSGERSSRGVAVEVGTKEVAIDMDLIVEFGFNLQDVAKLVRKAIYDDIATHTGLKAVEINITISDIHFPEEKKVVEVEEKEKPKEKEKTKPKPKKRVQ